MSMGAPVRHFLDLSDFSAGELRSILKAGEEIKARRRTPDAAGDRLLEGKVIAMIFEQPSLRTRVSFDVGIRELGGSPMMVTGQEIEPASARPSPTRPACSRAMSTRS